jgi:hypothetical protein
MVEQCGELRYTDPLDKLRGNAGLSPWTVSPCPRCPLRAQHPTFKRTSSCAASCQKAQFALHQGGYVFWPCETRTSTCRNFATISQAYIDSLPLQSSLMSKTYLKSDHFNGGGSVSFTCFVRLR